MARRLLCLLLLAACDRKDPTAAPATVDASPPAPSWTASPDIYTAPSSSPSSTPSSGGPAPSPIEAQRKKVTRIEDDPALVAAADALKKHYGGQIPKELSLQAADRPEGRGRALI